MKTRIRITRYHCGTDTLFDGLWTSGRKRDPMPRIFSLSSMSIANLPPARTSKIVEFVDNSVVSGSSHRSDKEYIDPNTAVNLEDIAEVRRATGGRASPNDDARPRTWNAPPSTADYHYDSSGSYIVNRGRGLHSGRRRSSPSPRSRSSVTSMSSIHNDERKWEHIHAEDAPIRHDSSMEGAPFGGDAQHAPAASCDNNEPCKTDSDRTPQNDENACQRNPPLHQDSGFDEEMIKDLTMTADSLATDHFSLPGPYYHEPPVEKSAQLS